VQAHFADPRLRAFNINIDDKGSREVSLRDRDQTAKCFFSWMTSPSAKSQEAKKAPTSKTVDIGRVIESLKGTCITRALDFWNYEICFGGHVKQSHGADVYLLARTGARQNNGQLYTGGDTCEALPNKDARQVKVEFACDTRAHIPTIVTLTEPKTCIYEMLIGTNQVCGDPTYRIVSAAEAASNEVIDLASEDWLLELVHLDDGRLMCSAYTTEHRAGGSKLNFQEFRLELKPHEGAVRSSNPKAHFVPRRPGRIPCGKDEVKMNQNSITKGSNFNGKLSFLKITT